MLIGRKFLLFTVKPVFIEAFTVWNKYEYEEGEKDFWAGCQIGKSLSEMTYVEFYAYNKFIAKFTVKITPRATGPTIRIMVQDIESEYTISVDGIEDISLRKLDSSQLETLLASNLDSALQKQVPQ